MVRHGKFFLERFIIVTIMMFVVSCSFTDVRRNSAEQTQRFDVQSDNNIQDLRRMLVETKGHITKSKVKKLSKEHVISGIAAFQSKNYVLANTHFQKALKFEPTNPFLHKLNAMMHHARATSGSHDQYDLARVGYTLARLYDPGDSDTSYRLGLLHFEKGEMLLAQEQFGQSVMLGCEDPNCLIGLAAASYYLSELDSAYAAIAKAKKAYPNNERVMQAYGMIHAAFGAFDKARETNDELRNLSPYRARHLGYRIDDWEKLYKKGSFNQEQRLQFLRAQNVDIFGIPNGGLFGDEDSTKNPLITQSADSEEGSVSSSAISAEGDSTSSAVGDNQQSGVTPKPSSTVIQDQIKSTETGHTNVPLKDANKPEGSTSSVNHKASQRATETKQESDPKQSVELPRMAVVDVTIIQTTEEYATNKGVNLLNGLILNFGGPQLQNFKTPGGSFNGQQQTTADAITLKLGAGGNGINYALNIFSDALDRNEVMARPTLIVRDNETANFTSGNNLHIALGGTSTGPGSVSVIPLTLTLTITPIFLSDNIIDLSVKAERSTLTAALSPVNDTLISTSFAQTSTISTSANLALRLGETMVLSGMTEQSTSLSDDKTPFLGDIPGLQYLFRSQRKNAAKTSVLILITPRSASLSLSDGSPIPVTGGARSDTVTELEQGGWIKPMPHLKAITYELAKYKFFNHFRKGDIALENFGVEQSLMSAVGNTLEYLYIFDYDFGKSERSELTNIVN